MKKLNGIYYLTGTPGEIRGRKATILKRKLWKSSRKGGESISSGVDIFIPKALTDS